LNFFFRVLSLAYPNLLGEKSYVVVVVVDGSRYKLAPSMYLCADMVYKEAKTMFAFFPKRLTEKMKGPLRH